MSHSGPTENSAPQLSIGSTVRVTSKVRIGDNNNGTKNEFETVARRAIVATLPESDDEDAAANNSNKKISLVQDDLAPRPLRVLHRGVSNFLFAPMFHSRGIQVEECESLVGDIMGLLPFERKELGVEMTKSDCAGSAAAVDDSQATLTTTALVQQYKDYGDQLMKLHDFTSAISYFEAALGLVSSKCDVVVGGSCVVRKDGHSVVAEVDCVDNDDGDSGNCSNATYDVTYILSDGEQGEEGTISQREIIMAIWSNDNYHSTSDEKPTQFLQIRILLNLSRCLLRLADIDHARGNGSCFGDSILSSSASIGNKKKNSDRREKYRLAAVLGSSVAITLCEYYATFPGEDSTEVTSMLNILQEKARIVRCRSFIGLQKFPNATIDTKKILHNLNPHNREAQKLQKEIKKIEQHNKNVDKKLSKEVCRWVDKATTSSNGSAAMNGMGNRSSDESVSDSDTEPNCDDEVVEDQPRDDFIGLWSWLPKRKIDVEIFSVISFAVAMWFVYPKV